MNIILDSDITPEIRSRYLLLELDTMRLASGSLPVRAYCVLEHLDMQEMMVMSQYLDLHNNLMHNYRSKNWNYVEQAIEHLQGRWARQLDTFYADLLQRVHVLRDQDLPESWDGIIEKY
jgi:hypothetical protein